MISTAPDSTIHYVYICEAKGIQRYIFDSGPLRDLIGASELVASLTSASNGGDPLIVAVAKAVGLAVRPLEAERSQEEHYTAWFSRCAAGAFALHSHDLEKLRDVQSLWRLVTSLTRPGLEFADTLLEDGATSETEALKRAYQSGSSVRFNSAAELPPAGGPASHFNPRTGRLVTRYFQYPSPRSNEEVDIVEVDVVTEAQRRQADRLQGIENDGVANRFVGDMKANSKDGKTLPYVFPRNLEHNDRDSFENPVFPFRGADRRIAVVHADLSGLGQIYMKAGDKLSKAKDRLKLSAAIEAAVESAAQTATQEILLAEGVPEDWAKRTRGINLRSKRTQKIQNAEIVPARPVVLGGDDLTIIVRGDLAVQFAIRLLAAIESKSKAKFSALMNADTDKFSFLPTHLSACAGVAIGNAGQPFQMLNDLAEGLCKFAKKDAKKDADKTKPYPSMLAFHNTTHSVREDYQDGVRAREMEFRDASGQTFFMSANPYGLPGACAKYRQCDDLLKLAKAFDTLPRGRGNLMEALSLLQTRPALADEPWKRWWLVREEDDLSTPSAKKAFDDIKNILGKKDASPPPLSPLAGLVSDALELCDLGIGAQLKDECKGVAT